MSVLLPTFRRVRLTQQCVIHPQDKGGNYLPCASEDWVLFVSLAAGRGEDHSADRAPLSADQTRRRAAAAAECLSRAAVRTGTLSDAGIFRRG